MNDIKAYIDSGILELYVLGKLTEAEQQEVRSLAALHPAIQLEIDAIEESLEAFALAAAVPPPPAVLPAILSRLEPPAVGDSAAPTSVQQAPAFASNGATFWRFLSLVAAGLLAFLSYQFFEQQQKTANLQTALTALQQACDAKEEQQALLAQQLAIFRNPAYQVVQLKGTEIAPAAFATILFNQQDQKAFLQGTLPPPPSGKQYQLWVLIGGQPTDMGVLALQMNHDSLTEVPFIEGAEAFAITLEDLGGHPSPDLTQLFVIGTMS